MSAIRLAILGAGELDTTPAILASLASYYGERPLEVRLYDADEERLDLFDRLARVLFDQSGATHSLISTSEPAEALVEADLVILAIGEHCAYRFLSRQGRNAEQIGGEEMIEQAISKFMILKPEGAAILNLMPGVSVRGETFYRLDWPTPLEEDARRSLPLQILRWLHKEEYPFDFVRSYEDSPLKRWLDNPSSADTVFGRS